MGSAPDLWTQKLWERGRDVVVPRPPGESDALEAEITVILSYPLLQ